MIDCATLSSECQKFTYRLAVIKERVSNAKKANRTIDKLRANRKELESMYNNLIEYYKAFKLINMASEEEAISYKYSRIDYLEDVITQYLGTIFPHDKFRAKIDRDFTRGKAVLELHLVDSWGIESDIFVTQGKLNQQLVSYVSSKTIAKLLGSTRMFLDEAFSQSDEENLLQLSHILDEDQKSGTQIFLIEQEIKSAIYREISHREILIFKDPKDLSSHITIVDL